MIQAPLPMPLEGSAVPPPNSQELSERDFQGYQRLIYREAGIHLGPTKKALLVGRLTRRLRELGWPSFREYLRRAEEEPLERVRLLDAICTHETHFFREPRHFEFLEREVLPRWRAQGATDTGGRRVRVWSAGCSTGEEPFTLAMVLLHHLPPKEGWKVEVVASDLSTRILERAQRALWPVERAREIPTPYLKAFMLKGFGSQEGWMKAGPELRQVVHFQRVNLNAERYPFQEGFDLIFCRNVLIYFDAASKERAIERLLAYLSPHGYLFVGHAESLSGLVRRVKTVFPTVYTVPQASHNG